MFEDKREWKRTDLEQLERNTACSRCESGQKLTGEEHGKEHGVSLGVFLGTRRVQYRARRVLTRKNGRKLTGEEHGKEHGVSLGMSLGTRRVPFQTDYFILFHPGLG